MLHLPIETGSRISAEFLRVQAARLCRREALGLLLRDHRKYARICAVLYVGHWRVERWRLRVLRACYFYFRLLDDVADGDRSGPIPADALLDEQLARWRSDSAEVRRDEVNLLFDHLWAEIVRAELPASRLRSLGESLVEGLRWDLRRRGDGGTPHADELADYYERVILVPAQIALIVLGVGDELVSLREISLLIGRLQSARDLDADRAAGLVNIPREAASEDSARWRRREVAECLPRMSELWCELLVEGDWRSRLVLGAAVKTLQKWARGLA